MLNLSLSYLQIKPEQTFLKVPGGTTAPVSDSDEDVLEDEEVETPYEYEVEEVRAVERMQEEVVERKLPQVKALYPYQRDNMKMEKGEVRLTTGKQLEKE